MELGIDPGRAKVGFAFVEGENLLASGVVPRALFGDFVRIVAAQSWGSLTSWLLEGDASSLEGRRIGVIVVGGGTGAEDARAELERA
ncbi:MAG TPA: crossover junction endodeoxyribonuclease RuvC, partial [Synergistaceae bacterium]|nr:crossover junction endodeoxyribonuclease RuvC [Synergistaceae bacterium]